MMVGQPLTLECIATTVRGINSQVDIVWTNVNNGTEVGRTDNVNSSMTNISIVYRDYFNISQLTSIDSGVEYECKVIIINANLSVTDSFTLDLIGKQLATFGLN